MYSIGFRFSAERKRRHQIPKHPALLQFYNPADHQNIGRWD